MHNSHASAILVSQETVNDEYYLGVVKHYDGDMYLSQEQTTIKRSYEGDAIHDAKMLLEQTFNND
jgi:hypothetical protein